MREVYASIMCLMSTLLFAQDDIGMDGVETNSLGRQVSAREGGEQLNDHEIRDLAVSAHTDMEQLERADLGVVPSEAAQIAGGGALGTVMTNTVDPVAAPNAKPVAGDLSRKRVQELLKKMFYVPPSQNAVWQTAKKSQ